MGFRPSPFLSRNSKNATSHARGRFFIRKFFKGKNKMNKLEVPLSKQDLGSLFSQKVEEVDNNHFYIRTKTHKIHIKNPKITWEKPYTEPKQTKIELVDTTETFIGATSPSRTELFFHGVASIENYPDLALFDSVILDLPIIEPFELLKNQQFSYNLDYHLWDFGTGEDIDLYDDTIPQDFVLSTITVKQIMIIKQFLENILEQCNERTVFEIVDYVANHDEARDAYNSESKEIIITVK